MRRIIHHILPSAVTLGIFAIGLTLAFSAPQARACGWGTNDAGGQAFVPQRQDGGGAFAQQPALTADEARQKIENHVHRLNSSLKIGQFNDAGALFEAEVLTAENEVVQIIGVDKASGQLVLIN